MGPKQAGQSRGGQRKSAGDRQGGDGAAAVDGVGLQAVVIADSLDESFRPVTCDMPKCLIPLCGVPLLVHTLEFLKRNEVVDVLLVTTHEPQILEFLSTNAYARMMKISTLQLSPASSLSFGDVLREVDDRACDLREDFILMFADTVSRIDLRPVMEEHRKRRQKDHSTLMTILFSPTAAVSRHRTTHDDAVVVYDATTRELIAWDSVHSGSRYKIDHSLLQRNSSGGGPIQIRHDLIDLGMSICTLQVLKLFSESFDHMSLRRDFCKDVLTKPIKFESIFVDVLDNQPGSDRLPFATRVANPRTFFSATCAFLERVMYPLVLDAVVFPDQPHLINIGRAVYRAKDSTLATNSKFGPHAALLPLSEVGDGSSIQRSVIGRRCQIGNDVVIDGCIILDDVIIEDGVRCKHAFISCGVKLHSDAEVTPGCVLGSGVIVGKGVKLPLLTKLTACEAVADPPNSDDEDEQRDDTQARSYEEERSGTADASSEETSVYRPGTFRRISEDRLAQESDKSVVGPDGLGIVFKSRQDLIWSALQSQLLPTEEPKLPVDSIGSVVEDHIPLFLPKLTLDSDDEETDADCSITDEDDSGDDRDVITAETDTGAPRGELKMSNTVNGTKSIDARKDEQFTREIRALVGAGLHKPDVMHHKLLEAKSYRLSTNRYDTEVIRASVPPLLDCMKSTPLEFSVWIDKFKQVAGHKIFEAFFDDSSSEHHYILYDALLDYCGSALTSYEATEGTKSRPSDASTADSGNSMLFGVFGSAGMLSFLLQVLARLELIDDEFTLSWHKMMLKREPITTDSSDKKETRFRLLGFDNLIDYIHWLEDS